MNDIRREIRQTIDDRLRTFPPVPPDLRRRVVAEAADRIRSGEGQHRRRMMLATAVATALAVTAAGTLLYSRIGQRLPTPATTPPIVASPVPTDTATPAPTPTVTPAATPSPAPTATPTLPPVWATYTDPQLGYSVQYPAAWHQRSAGGSSDAQVISNENVANLRQLDDAGFEFQLTVEHPQSTTASYCPVQADPTALQNGTITTVPTVLDGIPATRYQLQLQTAYGDELAVVHGGWCYSLIFISPSRPTLVNHDGDIRRIIASFRFNR